MPVVCALFDEETTEFFIVMRQIFILSVMRLLSVAKSRLRAVSSSFLKQEFLFKEIAFLPLKNVSPSSEKQARRT